jgi:hypothetical protein
MKMNIKTVYTNTYCMQFTSDPDEASAERVNVDKDKGHI